MHIKDVLQLKFVQNSNQDVHRTYCFLSMHIRRTDKSSNVENYHTLNEYMNYAEEWIAEYEYIHRVKLRRPKLYIATDEPAIIKEAKTG